MCVPQLQSILTMNADKHISHKNTKTKTTKLNERPKIQPMGQRYRSFQVFSIFSILLYNLSNYKVSETLPSYSFEVITSNPNAPISIYLMIGFSVMIIVTQPTYGKNPTALPIIWCLCNQSCP